MRRKIALLLVAGVVLVVMMFAMSPGFAAGKAKEAKAGGASCEKIEVLESKAGGVVAKAPCENPP